MTLKSRPFLPKPWRAMTVAAALTLGAVGAAPAAELHTGASGFISWIGSQNPYDSLRLVVGDPASHYNNLIYASMDMRYNLASYEAWESVTWRPGSNYPTQRFAAGLQGTDEFSLPLEGRYIQLRNLTLDRTDLDARNVQFRFSPLPPTPGTTTSLTLNNGSLTGLVPPGFNVNANFTLSATGDSSISNWWERVSVASSTTLNVTGAGSKLSFFRVGKSNGAYWEALYFHGANNTATIDGATLKLEQSNVTFGKPSPAPDPYGRMTFQNGATLELAGPDAKLESGEVSFVNSSLKLGLGVTKLIVDAGLTFNGASAEIAGTAKVSAQVFDVFGSNTIALPQEYSATDYTMKAGLMIMEPDSVLTLNGQGSLASDSELRWSLSPIGHYGRIVINDNASLVNDGGIFAIIPGAPITTQRTNDFVFGSMTVKNGGVTELRGSTSYFANFVNQGELSASTGGVITVPSATYNLLGGSQGRVNISEDGRLDIGNFGTTHGTTAVLNTDNGVWLDNFSTLKLTIDPTALKNSQLRTSAEVLIQNLAELNLGLVNDRVLPVGTKFVLIDYGFLSGTGGVAGVANQYFNGHRDGSSFVLGLNRYQINYKDSGDAGFAGAVTLTVIPLVAPVAAITPTTQTVNGTVGANLTPSASLVPSDFGGVVTYSINPKLPAGLKFSASTGVITGVPAAALGASNFTIRGTGATSGDANASVTLSVAQASQSVTFGAAPTPTYSPGGHFAVSASASSALPVGYSSTTPLVCSASDSGVTILSAGSCTIAANQPGNANYSAAAQVTQTITIAKAQPAQLTLRTTPNANGSITLSTSGGSGTGAISYATSAPCSVAGSTLTGSGSCTVTATQAADVNYLQGQSSPVTLQVGAGVQAPLVLSANPLRLNVNATSTLSTLGGSGSGAVSYAVSSGPCTVSGNILRATAAGQCQVVASKAGDGSFAAASSNTVTITVATSSNTFSYPSATANLGQAFSLAPNLTGWGSNAAFALVYGSLPAGLTLNTSTGVISGTPSGTTGVVDVVISVVENNVVDAALAVITVQPAVVTPASIPTLSEWGVILLSGLLALAAAGRLRNLPGGHRKK